jgi:cation diffusion facilitator CzcD-associated flavoprotein CzcO
VDSIVGDPVTAESLKPYYRQFCKRPCFHDEYLQTFNRPNVTLVDTNGKGVEAVTPRGIVANGVEYEVDCIIYATGFEVGTEYTRRAGYELYGRDGITLTDAWSDGVRTMHGLHARGFPNCFIMGPQQSGFTVNFPHMLDEQAQHIAYIVKHAVDNDIATVEVSAEAEQQWVDTILSVAGMGRQFLEECTPGYYNNEGQVSNIATQNGFYGGGSVAFFALLAAWREEGSLKGLELTPR